MRPWRERVQELRSLAARGACVEVLFNTEEGKRLLRSAKFDRNHLHYSDAETETLRACYGVLPSEVLALALGRTGESIRKHTSRRDLTVDREPGKAPVRRCPCGAAMGLHGHPIVGFDAVVWAEACPECGREVLYTLSWRGTDAVEEPERRS